MHTFNYEFDEIPLWREGGWEIGTVSGQAEIIIAGNEWHVGDIAITKTRKTTNEERAAAVQSGKQAEFYSYGFHALPRACWLYTVILNEISEGPTSVYVQDKVNEYRVNMRADRADYLYKSRRETAEA